jgi:hypothetical protein
MVQNFRNFETGPDPFGRTWKITFRWQQNAISIRHADTIDVKWTLECEGETQDKVIALPLPMLMKVSADTKRPITDSWCMKLAGYHLIEMIATWQDMDKELVTCSLDEITGNASSIEQADSQPA